MHLKDKTLSPPGGWRYTQPESGLTLTALTERDLLHKIIRHRANMGYPTEIRLADEVEDAICQGMSEEDRYEYCNNQPRPWPLALRPLKLLAQPGDTGLGDIVARTIGPVGGAAYQTWFESVFGRPCGCKKRQADLNRLYPV